MGQHLLQRHVEGLRRAEVAAECVAREHDPRAVVEGEHGVGPVQVGGHHELQHVAAPEVHLRAPLHLLRLEGAAGVEAAEELRG